MRRLISVQFFIATTFWTNPETRARGVGETRMVAVDKIGIQVK